jgi:hypothetical protein
MKMKESIEHYRVSGITLHEFNDGKGSWFVVMEPDHYRLRFTPHRESKTLSVGIDVEWSDAKPGQLANYTPTYENRPDDCQPGEVTISDEGLLSVMPQQRTARITIRMGWSAQLPRESVEPIRLAIALAEAIALNATKKGKKP